MSYYKLPQFPDMSTDPDLSDKSVHAGVVRVGPSNSKFAGAMEAIMQHYQWTMVALLLHPGDSVCQYAGSAIREMFAENNFTVVEYIQLKTVSSESMITSYLRRIRTRARGL